MVVEELHGESLMRFKALHARPGWWERQAQRSCAISHRVCRHVLEILNSEKQASSRYDISGRVVFTAVVQRACSFYCLSGSSFSCIWP